MTTPCLNPEIIRLLDRGKTKLDAALTTAELLDAGTVLARAIELYRAWYLDCGLEDKQLERQLFSAFGTYLRLESEVRKVAVEVMAKEVGKC